MAHVKRTRRIDSVHPRLRRDIRELSTLLGTVLSRQEGERLFRKVETFRRMTKAFRQHPTDASAARIESFVRRLSVRDAHRVVRAFHLYFLLANAADEAHRILLRSEEAGLPEAGLEAPLRLALDSLNGRTAVPRAARKFLKNATIRPVFTAHPTEATRQTVLRKIATITGLIIEKDRAEHRSAELSRIREELTAQVTLLWQTSDLRLNRVTVQDEVLRGLYFFMHVLFDSVPHLCGTIDRAFRSVRPDLRVTTTPVRLGSWMGGDRDGHPFVTSQVTRATLEQHRQAILGRYRAEIESLYSALSSSTRIARVPPALGRWVRKELRSVALPASSARTEPSEIYRWALRVIHTKLEVTARSGPGGYRMPSELLRDVGRLDAALRAGGAAIVADTYVLPLLWAIQTFGFSFASLDIRQNSPVIRAGIAALVAHGRPGIRYSKLPEEEKQSLLLRLLKQSRRIVSQSRRADPGLLRILEDFRVIAWARDTLDPSAIGSFILSHTEHVSDILSALLLAKEAGLLRVRGGVVTRSLLDVVPLFESIEDLRRSPETMRALLSLAFYRAHLRKRGNRQEIMIGYSDSSKDGGIVSAAFELYTAQLSLHEVARTFGVSAVFFHGRGGSVSRGGGPVYTSILAQPRETISGEIKVTEQGEMISAKYLVPESALYSLELMAASVLYCMNAPLRRRELLARKRHIQTFKPLSAAAREVYMSLTRHADFWEFYRAATPLDIIETIEIGSRPVSRTSRASLESLRAIPWVFSWTQSRLAITGWYGFGSAVESVVRSRRISWTALRRMYTDWPFFRALVDNMEMVLAKTDPIVGGRYLLLASSLPSSKEFGSRIMDEFVKSRRAVLRIKKRRELLQDDKTLRQSLQLRNPYLDPVHFIQLRFLREYRSRRTPPAKSSEILDLLRSSINGIASGMKNTG